MAGFGGTRLARHQRPPTRSDSPLGTGDDTALTFIKPVVEFFEIDRTDSLHGAKQELFSVYVDEKEHPYRQGLKSALCKSFGVYLFYDSRGRALYAGKALKQSLWKEMHSAYNRQRGGVQNINRVKHPTKRIEFRPYEEKRRQIRRVHVPLWDLAAYFSAYAVEPNMIQSMEAFLIRAFPNDLLNLMKENFAEKATRAEKAD